MPKVLLFFLAMALYYIIGITLITKLLVVPLLKALALVFFIGAGMIYTRKWRNKQQ